MTTRRKSSTQSFLESFPIATVTHLMAALALCTVFVGNGGDLPEDAVQFFAIVIGGNSVFAVGRGLAANRGVKVER